MFDLETLIAVAGYTGLFAIIFAESGLFFGFFLPGDSLLFTAGFLASQGLMNIWILIPTLFVAAVLGDNIGYSFGRYMGPKLFTRKESRFFKPAHLQKAHEFFIVHGKKAIFFCRFLPVVRTFVPIVAGVAEMPYRDFLTYNILGASVWAGGVTYLGYILGRQVPGAEEYLHYIVFGIVIVSFIPGILGLRTPKNKKTDTTEV